MPLNKEKLTSPDFLIEPMFLAAENAGILVPSKTFKTQRKVTFDE